MQDGEIYFVEIPLSGGHEQAGLRPTIIVWAAGSENATKALAWSYI